VLPLKPKVALPACGKEADRFVEGQRGLVEYPTSGKVLKEVGEEGLRLIKWPLSFTTNLVGEDMGDLTLAVVVHIALIGDEAARSDSFDSQMRNFGGW
jgi:hypothetical protein